MALLPPPAAIAIVDKEDAVRSFAEEFADIDRLDTAMLFPQLPRPPQPPQPQQPVVLPSEQQPQQQQPEAPPADQPAATQGSWVEAEWADAGPALPPAAAAKPETGASSAPAHEPSPQPSAPGTMESAAAEAAVVAKPVVGGLSPLDGAAPPPLMKAAGPAKLDTADAAADAVPATGGGSGGRGGGRQEAAAGGSGSDDNEGDREERRMQKKLKKVCGHPECLL